MGSIGFRSRPNLRYSRKVAWIIYPGDEFKTKRDSAIALITQHHLKNPCAPSSAAASTQQAAAYSVGITSLGPLSYNSLFIPPPALSTAIVQAQASSTPNTSTLLVSSQDLFQHNAPYSQMQLANNTMTGALPLPPVVFAVPAPPISLSGPAPHFGIPTMPQSPLFPLIVSSSVPVYVLPQYSTYHRTVGSQFASLHSQAHHHHTSAPAKVHRDRNGLHNAVNMANRFQIKDSKYCGADNEKIKDIIMQYDLVSRDFHLSYHEKRQ